MHRNPPRRAAAAKRPKWVPSGPREKATFCILRQPEMLHLETRIYFTLSSVVLYEFPQYEFPQAVRLYEFPQPVPVLDLASMVHVLQYR